MPASSEPPPRTVRVFISSTFLDMQGEREELVRRVFPQLRTLCEARGVAWGVVDLRWGITEEAQAEGRVLPICLEEIRRCRPYFVGLLGERYGWVPTEIDEALTEREPWLREHARGSVTELEILHGVLNDPRMASCSFFYFRDPRYIDTLPEASRPAYREEALPEEIARIGEQEAKARAGRRRKRLAALKQRIRESGLPLREGYADPKELGALVRDDLTRAIDELFPADEDPDPIAAAAAEHRRFAATRRASATPRVELLQKLDQHASNRGPPLAVVGPSGSGKTTLLAMWSCAFRQMNPSWQVIDLYAEATPRSTDWEPLARLLAGRLHWSRELQERVAASGEGLPAFDLRHLLPRTPDALRDFLSQALTTEPGRPTVVVLDGVDRVGSNSLGWLPETLSLPLIVSSAPGPAAEEMAGRGWKVMEMDSLSEHQRRRFLVEGLAHHGKQLESRRIEKITSAPATSHPLFLGALIEELRVHGHYETLDETIDRYLQCRDARELFSAMLSRFEGDHEEQRPGLVRDALSLLGLARRGLSESELLGMLGTGDSPLPQAIWAPLHQALRPHLVERRGRLSFLHRDLSRAVEQRYLPTDEGRRRLRLGMAHFFRARGWTPRSVFEVPWQLERAGAWTELTTVLAEPSFLARAWVEPEPTPIGGAAIMGTLLPPAATTELSYQDVLRWWASVERHSDLRAVEAYRPILASPGEHEHVLLPLSRLLGIRGHEDEARIVREWIVERVDDARARGRALMDEAKRLARERRWGEALAKLDEAESIYRETRDVDGLLACAGNRAIALQSRGDLGAALRGHRDCERLARQLHNPIAVATSLSNQAWIASAQERKDDALALYQRALQLAREGNDPQLTTATLGWIAELLEEQGRPREALGALEEQLTMAEEVGDTEQLAHSIRRMAESLHRQGRDSEAIESLGRLVRLGDRLGRADILFVGHKRCAELLLASDQLAEALAAARQARGVAAKMGMEEECEEVDGLIEAIEVRAAQLEPPQKSRWRFW